ncbi:MAG TPA: RteC domain-containing protein [Puia sp.]|uniref:RteC domain-containing protein n=1 Tax=Puia sp. TaxID=2045100 RepID=UPI002C68299E|nr:RteC domain-containing protein [Puia sp.]HVU97754.1 RteC domain-containing protein [Puia sp.]
MDNSSLVSSTTPQLWERLQHDLDDQLAAIQKEESQILSMAHRGSQVSSQFLHRLVESVVDYAFGDGEEVLFYKKVKPYFLSRVIYFNRLYNLEMDRPAGASKGLEDFYRKASQEVAKIYEQHRFIYRYLRSGATHLDEKFFFHPHAGSVVALSGMEPPDDARHPVCYDHVAAHLLVADAFQMFLQEALQEIQTLQRGPSGTLPRVTWTDSKTSLIELAYALQSAGVLNNGKIDLKDVIDHLQTAFHVNLGNYPRTFQEILARKTGYTNFIDRLKAKLLLRIQQIEDKYDRG